jgi:hypothetical protein
VATAVCVNLDVFGHVKRLPDSGPYSIRSELSLSRKLYSNPSGAIYSTAV